MRKNPRFIKVHAHSFYTLLNAIKKYENVNEPIKIRNVSLSKFLLRASDFETSGASLPYEVKIAILLTYGISHPDPGKLKDNKSMADFNFNSMQNISLTRKFNKVALSHNAAAKTITLNSVINCDKVSDCITLVANASQFSISQIPAL